ncbi:MAG TPA: VWA domain-containing protein [Jatrophihabitantaceae bacterium]|nr:VWA domain-containing protein [Jatrophihabitantaceae bacterium]
MGLVEHHTAFLAALREAGLAVSVSEGLDAVAAVRAVTLADRDVVREAYAATVVKRPVHRPVFDTIFDLYYPAVVGETAAVRRSDGSSAAPENVRPAPAPWEVDDPVRMRLRDELRQFLLTGDEQLGLGVARDAVSGLGAQPGTSAGQPSWSPLTVMTRLSPETLLAGLLAQLLDGRPDDEFAERLERARIDRRIRRFRELVEAEARRRYAEQRGVDEVARAARPSIDKVPFGNATASELAELRREVAPLARRLAARLAVKQRAGRRGQLDFRRTIRGSLSTGGVPLTTVHRPRRPAKTDLVILADVSESVLASARFTLMLVHALREQFSRVRTFAFVDEIDEVTRYFAPGTDVTDAVARLTQQAQVTWLLGRTDYGRAFERFEEKYADAVGHRTSLLILGDARSNYGDIALPALQRLVERAHAAHWLNPERRAAWDTGDSAASRFDAVVPMVECRNLAQLADFVKDLPL